MAALCVYSSARAAEPNGAGQNVAQPSPTTPTTRPAAAPQGPQAAPVPEQAGVDARLLAERLRELQMELAAVRHEIVDWRGEPITLRDIRPGPGTHTYPGFRADFQPRPDTGVGLRASNLRTPRTPRHVFGPLNAGPASGPVGGGGQVAPVAPPDYQ